MVGKFTVAASIADFAGNSNNSHFGPVGLVIGATINIQDFGIQPEELSQTPILAPGFGHQGAKLVDVVKIFGTAAKNVICNVGRSITSGGQMHLISRINEAKAELGEGLAKL